MRLTKKKYVGHLATLKVKISLHRTEQKQRGCLVLDMMILFAHQNHQILEMFICFSDLILENRVTWHGKGMGESPHTAGKQLVGAGICVV